MVKFPFKMVVAEIFSDPRYLSILLTVKNESLTNNRISKLLQKDHSQTRPLVSRLAERKLLMKKDNKYLLWKKNLSDEIISYLVLNYKEIMLSDTNARFKEFDKETERFGRLLDSSLVHALVEVYINTYFCSSGKDNFHSFVLGFAEFVKSAIDVYKIQHKDVDLLINLCNVESKSNWTYAAFDIFNKFGIQFKPPTNRI
jgi:Mn-dependent DtxR family transcriptional regulator